MLKTLMTQHSVSVPKHLEDQIEISVSKGLQRQGDIYVLPQRPGMAEGKAVPPQGIPVVRGEAGGNTHLLVGEGISWRALTQLPELGVVTVPEGKVAYLLHPEHGANGIGAGEYLIRRQVEWADEMRVVAD